VLEATDSALRLPLLMLVLPVAFDWAEEPRKLEGADGEMLSGSTVFEGESVVFGRLVPASGAGVVVVAAVGC